MSDVIRIVRIFRLQDEVCDVTDVPSLPLGFLYVGLEIIEMEPGVFRATLTATRQDYDLGEVVA